MRGLERVGGARARALVSALAFGATLGVACSSQKPLPDAPPADEGVGSADVCDPDNPAPLRVRFDPPAMVVAPGGSRPARVIVDPDVCAPATLSFEASGGVRAIDPVTLDHRAEQEISVAIEPGAPAAAASVVAIVTRPGGGEARAELAVDVRAARVPACAPGASAKATLSGAAPSFADGAGSAISAPAAAFARTDELALPPMPVEIACDGALAPNALGPAIAFRGPPERMVTPLRRELSFELPIDPASLPPRARLRHLRVWYKGPHARTPREVAVSGAHVVRRGDGYALAFRSPWLGTYQASVDADAGERRTKRRVTHRAILGISMGAGGAASFGLRHASEFDTIAMLGGPIDWTWLLWYVERFAMGGFCPHGQTCAKTAPGAYPLPEPFVHTMDYDHLWLQDGAGAGGISRREYVSMLTDLALARGNPLSENADPALSFFARGPKSSDPWGGAGDPECRLTVRPILGDPDEAAQRERESRCDAAMCDPSHRFVVPTGYFDDEYNPDGTEQVISFCDGSSVAGAASPYESTWAPPRAGEQMPVRFALAVDTNKNGVRDEGEPVIRSGHEPYDDTGTDGVPDSAEPGYDALTNPDPNGDDYDPMLAPAGTEGDHRYSLGEPFRDVGLDGVPDTAARSAVGDPGEGDGVYTEASGLSAYYAIDPHALLRGLATDASGAAPPDEAFERLRVWTDGGVRDFMNFGRDADHFQGALSTRAPGRPRAATLWGGFDDLPGQPPSDLTSFDPNLTLWADLPRAVGVRYGDVDATPAMISEGDGQHVGTGAQILARLNAAYHFIGEGWPDADRVVTEASSARSADTTTGPLGITCEVAGSCVTTFTGPKSGRSAPVTVVLPPGYGHAANQDERYPVVYILHGYGQQQSDVTGLGILTLTAMNDGSVSYVDRLPKFIAVYVDGRCRGGAAGADCVAGTFFLDALRPGGARVETWMEELMAWVDASFRTMPETEIESAD